MGQVISTVLSYLGVGVKRDEVENRTQISHAQGQSCCISIFLDNDTNIREESVSRGLMFQSTDLQPLLGDAIVILDDSQLTDMSYSESYLGLNVVDLAESHSPATTTMSTTAITTSGIDTMCDSLSSVGNNSIKLSSDEEIEELSAEEIKDIFELISVPYPFSSKQRQRKSIGPYNSSQRILLVGEGDFSFSACLAIAFGSASNIIATSLNSLEFLLKNYGNFPMNQLALQTRGSTVIHGVDATKMANHGCLCKMKFNCVIYNFPHTGFKRDSPQSQIKRHQKLVRDFLKNAKKMLEDDGEIHITHKSNPFFLKWDIPKLGSDQGLHLIQAVKFKASKFPGYHTKYGFGGDKDFDCNPSKTYKFKVLTGKSS